MSETNFTHYSEERAFSSRYRKNYLASVEGYLSRLEDEAEAKRALFISPKALASDNEGYRRAFLSMLGEPLRGYGAIRNVPVKCLESTDVDGVFYDMDGGRYSMRRIRLDVLHGFEMYGILFLPEGGADSPMPLVISQHGGAGTPELCSDFYGDTNYNHLTRRILSRGAIVFAPQLLLWNINDFGDPYDRRQIDCGLKKLGSSITALEVFGIMRCIDWLAAQPFADPDRIGMAGLSYGGFYTLMTAAADTRIRAAYTSCALIDMTRRRDFTDWMWDDSMNTFGEAEIAGLIAPRAYCVDAGDNDDLFGSESTVRTFARAKEYYAAQGAEDNIFLKVFKGGHELDPADDCFDFFFDRLMK